jgi:hypothetical protein
MALPEFVTPAIAVVGTPALIYGIVRSSQHAVRAVVLLLAGVVAIVTRDPKRRVACIAIVDKMTRRDAGPPGPDRPPRREAIGRGHSAR